MNSTICSTANVSASTVTCDDQPLSVKEREIDILPTEYLDENDDRMCTDPTEVVSFEVMCLSFILESSDWW